MLGLFNLIPIPPLDGSKVVMGFLPREAAVSFAALENYGPMVLIAFLFIFIFFFSGPLVAAVNFLTSLLVGA
jgi:Zn-dependent protease